MLKNKTDGSPDSAETEKKPPGNRPKTGEMIERFKRFYGYRFDTDMARKLDLSDGSAIGNWRRRDSIDLLLIADYCPEINLDWLIWGRGSRMPAQPSEESTKIPNALQQLQQSGMQKDQIIMMVNEALEKYLKETGQEIMPNDEAPES